MILIIAPFNAESVSVIIASFEENVCLLVCYSNSPFSICHAQESIMVFSSIITWWRICYRHVMSPRWKTGSMDTVGMKHEEGLENVRH